MFIFQCVLISKRNMMDAADTKAIVRITALREKIANFGTSDVMGASWLNVIDMLLTLIEMGPTSEDFKRANKELKNSNADNKAKDVQCVSNPMRSAGHAICEAIYLVMKRISKMNQTTPVQESRVVPFVAQGNTSSALSTTNGNIVPLNGSEVNRKAPKIVLKRTIIEETITKKNPAIAAPPKLKMINLFNDTATPKVNVSTPATTRSIESPVVVKERKLAQVDTDTPTQRPLQSTVATPNATPKTAPVTIAPTPTHRLVQATVTTPKATVTPKTAPVHVAATSSSPPSPSYRCEMCKKNFKERLQLLVHQVETHTRDTCPVLSCGRTFASTKRMEKHLKRHLDGDDDEEEEEEVKVEMKDEEEKEMRDSRKRSVKDCPTPKESAKKQRCASVLTPASSSKRAFVCAHCEKTYTYKGSYEKHLLEHEGTARRRIKKEEEEVTYNKRERKDRSCPPEKRTPKVGKQIKREGFPCLFFRCGQNFEDSEELKEHGRKAHGIAM